MRFALSTSTSPKEEDLSRGILETIDMDSYRVEKQSDLKTVLPDSEAEIEPVPTSGGGRKPEPEPELDRLSNILGSFYDQFANIGWKDADKIGKVISEEIPAEVAADPAYQNAMRNSDRQNAWVEHDKALQRIIVEMLTDHTELFKQFMDNQGFKEWLSDTVFGVTYSSPPPPPNGYLRPQ